MAYGKETRSKIVGIRAMAKVRIAEKKVRDARVKADDKATVKAEAEATSKDAEG